LSFEIKNSPTQTNEGTNKWRMVLHMSASQ